MAAHTWHMAHVAHGVWRRRWWQCTCATPVAVHMVHRHRHTDRRLARDVRPPHRAWCLLSAPRLRCAWSFRHHSPGKYWCFPFKTPKNGAKNSERIVGATTAVGNRGLGVGQGSAQRRTSEQDAKLAQKLGQLQPFIAVFPQECWANLQLLGQPNTLLAISCTA
jgi:hypothetical protein